MEQFSVEEGTLIPTLKLRRFVDFFFCSCCIVVIMAFVCRKDVYNKYKEVQDALYALGEPTPSNVKL
jgi:hypothetical protein